MLRLHIHQTDASNKHLHADIAGDVYIENTDDDEVEPGWC